jgi:hypothetical protein
MEGYTYVDHNGKEVIIQMAGGLERKQQIIELCKAAFTVDSYYQRYADDMMMFITAALLHDQCFRMKQVDVARLLGLRDTEGYYYINKGRAYLQIPAIRMSIRFLAEKMGVGLVMSEIQPPSPFTKNIPPNIKAAAKERKQAKRTAILERKNAVMESIRRMRQEDQDAD